MASKDCLIFRGETAPLFQSAESSVRLYKQCCRVAYTALLLLALSACGTTPQYAWYHNHLTGQAAQQQFTIDNGACTAAAYRAVGEPPGSRDTITDFSASTY